MCDSAALQRSISPFDLPIWQICLTWILHGCRFAWVQIMKTNLKIWPQQNTFFILQTQMKHFCSNSIFLSGNSGSKLKQSLIRLHWFDPVSRVSLFHPAEKHNFSFSFLWGQLNLPCAPNPKDINFHYNCRQEFTYSDFHGIKKKKNTYRHEHFPLQTVNISKKRDKKKLKTIKTLDESLKQFGIWEAGSFVVQLSLVLSENTSARRPNFLILLCIKKPNICVLLPDATLPRHYGRGHRMCKTQPLCVQHNTANPFKRS